MSLANKPLETLAESDFQGLIDNQVSEGKTIDYKEELPGNSDSEKGEFLADVSSFANTTGGHLILGMKEKAGIPTMLSGLQISDPDAEILRLENIRRDGIDPRIPGVIMKAVPLQKSGIVIVIRIPKSWASPHMVTFKNSSKFYSRNSAGKYQLDVSEIRSLFVLSESITERIRNFRADRLSKIVSGETPVVLANTAKIVLHMMPLSAFDTQTMFDPSSMPNIEMPLFPLSCSSFCGKRFNLDGFLTFDEDQQTGIASSYLQVFRSGIIETVDTSLLKERNGRRGIPSIAYEKDLMEALERCLKFQKSIGIAPPIFIMVSLLGVYGYNMIVDYPQRYPHNEIDRDSLILPEIMIDGFEVESRLIMKPIFDGVWNSAGFPRSLNYDENRNWRGEIKI